MISFLIFIFIQVKVQAEYRAFELSISIVTTSPGSVPSSNSGRVVLSTLDHLQYPMYYHLRKDERIQIVSTWMCRNRTDQFQPICEKPAPAVKPDLNPASKPAANSATSPTTIPAAAQSKVTPTSLTSTEPPLATAAGSPTVQTRP